jgi:GT2 family glycosyltransferase
MLEQHPRVVAAMPSVVYADRPDTVQFDGADCHFLGLQILRGQEAPVASRPTTSRPMSSLVTSCFLLDRSRANGATFDESLFTQYEDHDFGVRLRALGGELLSVPQALCYHGRGTVGLSIRQLGAYSPIRVLGLIRNRWALVLKTWSLRTLLLLTPVIAVYELAQLVMVIKRGWLREWMRAVWWMLTHFRELLEKRRRVQRAKEVPDRQLLQDGPLPFRSDLASDILERAGQRALNNLATAYWRLVAPLV